MTDHLVEEILPPGSVDAPDAADFIATVDVKNALELEGYGTDELSYTAAEALPGWHDSERPIRKFIVYVVSRDGGGERLVAPTGFGSVPQNNAEVRFLLGHGFSLEQVERASRLALPVSVSSLPVEPEGYRLHCWAGRTPETGWRMSRTSSLA